jgi:O-antigen/teichoic acid export membrane protein
MPDTKRSESLRERVLKGGVYLTLRNGASMILGFVGSLLVTRLIGPENYGLYMAAFGVFIYLSNAISPSVAAYLVREQSPDFLKHFHLAFWWLLGLGVIAAAVASGAVIAIAQFLGQSGDFQWILVSQFVSLPLALISAVPQALLERDLNYRPLAIVQLGSQTALYLAAVLLAWSGLGAWALVGGFWLSQTVQLAGYYAAARYRPRWYWSHANWKQMMHYSVSQSLSVWIYNLRDLAPSLILFPLAGERAVGYYALANRLINTLGFLYSVSGRVAFAAFARLQENKERLTKAIQETIQYLILFLGVVLTVFAASVGWVASWVLGAKWDASVIQQLCIVMASRVLIAIASGIQTQALYVIGQNWLRVRASVIFIIVFAASSWLLLSQAPVAYAPLLFAIADLFAHIPVYGYDIYGVRKYIGRVDYRLSLLWLAAAQAALFAPLIGYWLYIVAIGLLVHPMSIQGARGIVRSLKRDYLERGSA